MSSQNSRSGTPVLSQWRRMRGQQQGVSPNNIRNDPILWQQPPFLTVVLLNITKVLPKYCDSIARATFGNVTKAAAVFTMHHPSRPPSSHPSPSSPLAFLQWMKKHHPSSAEGEWKHFVSPFLLMAAADVLAARLEHLRASNDLVEFYQRIQHDLQQVQEVLCEPFLRRSNDESSSLSAAHNYAEDAARLTSAIRALTIVLAVRCQWIVLQQEAMRGDSFSIVNAAIDTTLLLKSVEALNEENPYAVQPILLSLMQELKAWKYCLETFAALEQCQFMETILRLRYWQLHLPVKDYGTQFAEWMRQLYQTVLGLLPIYFDRIRVFATQFYGFDTSLLQTTTNETSSNDCNRLVKDFLRRQEKLGGPSMAVALVLNAVSTSNVHVERGFRLVVAEKEDSSDTRVTWPAIYLRCSRQVSNVPPPPPPPAPNASSSGGSGLFHSSQTNLLSNWSSAGSVNSSPLTALIGGRKQSTLGSPSPGSSLRKSFPTAAVSTVLDYGPDSGVATSWPHNDWDTVVDLLAARPEDDRTNETVKGPVTKDELCILEGESSIVYTVPLGPHVHLIVMVKESVDESSGLPRARKLGIDRTEIQTFLLDVLAPKLRRANLFSSTLRNLPFEPLNAALCLPDRQLDARFVDNWWKHLSSRGSERGENSLLPRSKARVGGDAARFFLGPELALTLDDDSL